MRNFSFNEEFESISILTHLDPNSLGVYKARFSKKQLLEMKS